MVKIKNLPEKFNKLFPQCLDLLENSRPGDLEHTIEMLQDVLAIKDEVPFDADVIIPAIMLHDIVHLDIIENHYKDIVLKGEFENGESIELSLAGKMIKEMLEKINIFPERIEEVIEIVDMKRDYNIPVEEKCDTPNKMFFHDLDLLTRFNKRALHKMRKTAVDKEQFRQIGESILKLFFNEELKKIAAKRLKEAVKTKDPAMWGHD